MEMYSEKELIDFANECISNRYEAEYNGINYAELQNWKENLKQKRREQKINQLLDGCKN